MSIGIIGLIVVSFYGLAGLSIIALISILPFIRKKKLSEAQKHVFFRAGNYTLMILIFILILIFYFSDISINNIIVGENWFPLICLSIISIHGITGLLLMNAETE